MPPFEPVQFGKYRLIQPLAQGGMAEIFLAKQQGPKGYEKTVVIKRILDHWSSNPEFVEMFLDEARLAAQLSHPSIVQIFDFGEVNGSYYICMEYLRGEDLHTLVNLSRKTRTPIPPQVAATIISAAADGLHYAHTLASEDGHPLHIVHRDISPSNIFVTYQGQVKVLDFGIARAEGKVVRTATGVVKGKLAYMSPEQAMGGEIDGRVDVWALGATLYELLTSTRLFWKETEALSLNALLKERIPLPSESASAIPKELDEVCRNALDRDLNSRYPDAQAMYKDLDDYLSSRTYVPAQRLLQQFITDLVGPDVVAQKMKTTGAAPQLELPEPLAKPRSKPTAATANEKKRAPEPLATRAQVATPPPSARRKLKDADESEIQPLDDDAPPPRKATAPKGVAATEKDLEPQAKKPPVALIVGGALGVGMLGTVIFLALRPATPAPEDLPVRYAKVVVKDDHDEAPAKTQLPAADADAGAVAQAQPEKTGGSVAEPPRPTRGTLDVNCVPWCQIFIDGKDTGRTSPAMGIALSSGKHHLKVVNPPTGVEREEELTIRGGEHATKIVKF